VLGELRDEVGVQFAAPGVEEGEVGLPAAVRQGDEPE
jgi:hypothetical protein